MKRVILALALVAICATSHAAWNTIGSVRVTKATQSIDVNYVNPVAFVTYSSRKCTVKLNGTGTGYPLDAGVQKEITPGRNVSSLAFGCISSRGQTIYYAK